MSACATIHHEPHAAVHLWPLMILLGCACDLEPHYPSDDPLADCGNGQVAPDEECDDGNRVDGDGCSAECLNRASAVWTQILDGPSGASDCGRGIALAPDGNIVIAGSMSAGDTRQDMWIALLTPAGEVIWSQTTDGGAGYFDTFNDVEVSQDGTIYVVGTKWSSPEQVFAAETDTWVEALSLDGERLWSITLTGGAGVSSHAWELAAAANGVVVVGGRRIMGQDKAWSFNLNAQGEVLWDNLDDSDLRMHQMSTDVALAPEHDIYVVGYSSDAGVNVTERYYWLSRRSSTGDKIWTREIGKATKASNADSAALAIDKNGHLWIAYEVEGSKTYTTDIRIERLSPDAEIEFEDIYRGPGGNDDDIEAIAIAPTGAIVLAGDTYINGYKSNIWLQVYEPSGVVAWTRTIGEVGDDVSTAVTVDAGHVYATGCVGSQWLPSDVWAAKVVL